VDLEVAGLRPGLDTAAIRLRLGTPEDQSGETWKYRGIELQVIAGKLNTVWIRSRRWATTRRVRVGSSEAAVRRAYGVPTWTDSTGVSYVAQPDTSNIHWGLSFAIRERRVSGITSGVIAITVH